MFLERLALAELQKSLSCQPSCVLKCLLMLGFGSGLGASCRCAGRLRKQFGVNYDIFFGKMPHRIGIPPHPAVNMQLHGGMLIGYVLTCRKL